MKSVSFLLLFSFFGLLSLHSETYGGKFYDSGGLSADYSSVDNIVATITPNSTDGAATIEAPVSPQCIYGLNPSTIYDVYVRHNYGSNG